ncbi:histidine phosphatase family protein [Acidomonas methanolica]|uniref:Phosphoglycerate mutase n=2 Tax=Acidomonas methanolica TaxID=437 RepID=A0A023D386_ACIMT|nr:histidine phosphatase family protein [Acidomonas methanolica]MBU2654106.1 histidine phosphatase family protein [Acidomonas methanolica]TCS30665.1 putative phosphoglycerate mutase [Acidomonas methanolica]GAJ28205.1 phosphoglycerate mutase [Acidomonas methanolica NBRC 104435]GBQ58494.1 fructose-2,6-bisphosphatase [Acidomonas methanolica]GEK98947.1 phosphoglycerate mutase [Acidomonas methanolica NBRC 104435]
MQPFTVILVRHGHVEGIEPPRFRGRIDLPLTERGRRQAVATADFISSRWTASAIYSSPLSRCMDTAEAIAKKQTVPVLPLPDLLDIDYGTWQGRTRDEVKSAAPELFKAWMEQPHLTVIDRAETLQDVQARLIRAFDLMRRAHPDGTVIAIGHDSTNRIFVSLALDLSLSHYWRLQQDPCAINVLRFDDAGSHVVSINQTAHLAADL